MEEDHLNTENRQELSENLEEKEETTSDVPKNGSDLLFQKTGIGSAHFQTRKKFYSLTTLEMLIGAILGVMGGFISGLIPFSLLIKTWYPFVGGTQLVSGHHILWMFIAYGLTKKILIVPFTAIIKGFINFLLGAQWGAIEILISLYEGFFLMVGILFILFIKEEKSYFGWGIAGGIGNAAQVPLFWLMTGKIYVLHWTLFVMACMFGFLSGVIIAGVLGLLITKKILDTKIFES